MTLICYGHFIPQIVFPFVFKNKNKQAGWNLTVFWCSQELNGLALGTNGLIDSNNTDKHVPGFLMFSVIKWISIRNKWVNRWQQYRQTCTHLLVCVRGVEKGRIGNKWVKKSSHRGALYQKDIFENLTNFTGKHLCWKDSNKIDKIKFIKKGLQHSYFLAKFTKFLRTPILKNICKRLLLY